MVYTEVEKKIKVIRETIPLNHKVQNGPSCFLNTFTERNLGAAESRLNLRPQQFMSKRYV